MGLFLPYGTTAPQPSRMKPLVILGIVATLTLACASPECRVSSYGEWSECEATHCTTTSPYTKPFSFPLNTPVIEDVGRHMMRIMMDKKLKQRLLKQQCQEDNTCPEINDRASSGAFPCDGGYSDFYPCRNIDMLSHISLYDLGCPRDNDLCEGNDIWGWTDPETNDEYAIIGMTHGTSFVRVTDAENPKVLAFMPTRTVTSTWRDMKVIQNTAYIVSEARGHGMQVFDLLRLRGEQNYKVVQPDVVYSLFGNAHNIVANEETNFLYVVGATNTGSGYRVCEGGLHIINVNDRLNPKYAGCYGDDGYVHDAQCVVYRGPDTRYNGREVCFCYNEDTLTLVDVTNKNDMVMLSRVGYSTSLYTHQGWLTEDHEMVLLDDELDEYIRANTRTYLWDVRDLTNPILMNTYQSTQRAIDHNQYVHKGLSYQSNYGAGLRIMHIDQQNYDLREVAYFDVYPARTRVEFVGSWSNYPYFKSGNIIVSSIEFGLFTLRPHYEIIDQIIPRAGENQSLSGQQHRHRVVEHAEPGAVCPNLEEFRKCQPENC